MKFKYELTQQTIKAVNGHAREVADEMGCSDKHIYAILANSYSDPFAVFERFYAAAVRAGCDVSHWDNRLDAIKAKYRGSDLKCVERETAKFVKESSDVPIAHIDERPLRERLSEVTQAIDQGEVLRAALIDAIAKEEDQQGASRAQFPGKEVLMTTRTAVKAKLRRVG